MNGNSKPQESPKMREFHAAGLLRDMDIQIVASLASTFRAKNPQPSDEIQTLLALAVGTTADGHICLDLNRPDWRQLVRTRQVDDSDDIPDKAALLAALPAPQEARDMLARCSWLVGDGTGPQPFVLDRDRLYLRRFWNYENLVARKLRQMATTEGRSISPEIEGAIASLVLRKKGPDGENLELSAGQKEAVRKGLLRQLTIVTGGPGTGKTTVAALLLQMLARQTEPGKILRVRMAAPTGKAATRLDESVRNQTGSETATLELEPASTIERLLGYRKDSPYFRHNRENPLPADVVLVDEASMIDLPKMAKLLDALSEKTRLVLLGDKNQLASVDPGSVMAELCESSTLRDCVTGLTESKRFNDDSAVKPLSLAVNDMQADMAWEVAHSNAGAAGKKVVVRDSSRFGKNKLPDEFASAIKTRYAAFCAAESPEEAFKALAQFRVLCALRRGPTGASRINAAIEDILYPNRKGEFYDHRVILVTKNDYEIHLFNGDVGIVLPDSDRDGALAVFFEGRPKSVPCRLLPEHETAFAMTVHKAQGSGFGHVAVVLPDRESPILTRELIYTAITRTETGVDLWCEEQSFMAGARKKTERSMGLKDKLDAAQDAKGAP